MKHAKPPAQAEEIVAAVRELLRAAADAQDGRHRFDLRVAARLMGLLERELAQGRAAQDAELDGLRGLLQGAQASADIDAQRAALCERIAEGELGLDHPAFMDHLWRSALAQIHIDSPGYRWHADPESGS